MDDPFVQDHDASELEIAGEFLTNWLPFLTRNLCHHCSQTLTDRIRSLRPDPSPQSPNSSEQIEPNGFGIGSDPAPSQSPDPQPDSPVPYSSVEAPYWGEHIEPTGWGTDPKPEPEPEPDADPSPDSLKVRMSWADMAQEEDELEEEEDKVREKRENEEVREGGKKKVELSREQREWIRFNNVGRKEDYICLERVKGKIVNILEGLELHTGVFSAAEQKRIVDYAYELQEKGRRLELAERTYSEPQKWMRGKGRVTIQFGCCYNYSLDKDGNLPGILQNVVPDPIPDLFKVIIRRLVRWHVLPTSCVPDSCIVNIYEPGDCIPPHIDSHNFVRPFSTVSFLSECNILFGTNLKIEGAGDFSGSAAIPLPVGSVLVLNGNGADVAKHCVPAVPAKRISITFRKMDETKQPNGFIPEPDLQNIQPLHHENNKNGKQPRTESRNFRDGNKYNRRTPGGTQHQLYDSETTTPSVRLRQVIDVRSATNSNGLLGRAPGSAERPTQHQPYDSEMTLHTLRLRQVINVRSATNGNGLVGIAAGSVERPLDSRSRSSSQDIRRLRDADNEPFQRSQQQDWSDESGVESGRRRVRLDQKRIVISRNVGGEETPLTGSQSFERPTHSRRVVNSGRRRVKVVIADDE